MNVNSRIARANFTGFASGSPATFTGLRDASINVRSYINAIQSGSGDPAPDNIRPIIGRDSVTITANSVNHVISLDDTVYGGSLDVTTGVLTVTHNYFRVNTIKSVLDSKMALVSLSDIRQPSASGYTLATNSFRCNIFKSSNYSAAYDNHIHFVNTNAFAIVSSEEIGTNVSDWVTWLNDNPCYLCYQIANTYDIQLTPTQVEQLPGANNIFSDSGNVEVYYVNI